MENRSHLGETKENRLNRFQNNPPTEIIETLINSIHSFFNNEIRATCNHNNPQTSLLILGIHSASLTLAYGFFNKQGLQGYKLFLENFVDGDTPDTKFSTIATEIHEWRNVIAHRWLNVAGHRFSYDFTMSKGWIKEDNITIINPKIYLDCYLKAFEKQGGINYEKILTTNKMLKDASFRFISKFVESA